MMNLSTHRVTLCDDEYEAKLDAHFMAQQRAPFYGLDKQGRYDDRPWRQEAQELPPEGAHAATAYGQEDAEAQVSDSAVHRWKWAAIVVTLAWVAFIVVCLREIVKGIPQ